MQPMVVLFPGAVGPQDAEELPRLDGERDVAHRLHRRALAPAGVGLDEVCRRREGSWDPEGDRSEDPTTPGSAARRGPRPAQASGQGLRVREVDQKEVGPPERLEQARSTPVPPGPRPARPRPGAPRGRGAGPGPWCAAPLPAGRASWRRPAPPASGGRVRPRAPHRLRRTRRLPARAATGRRRRERVPGRHAAPPPCATPGRTPRGPAPRRPCGSAVVARQRSRWASKAPCCGSPPAGRLRAGREEGQGLVRRRGPRGPGSRPRAPPTARGPPSPSGPRAGARGPPTPGRRAPRRASRGREGRAGRLSIARGGPSRKSRRRRSDSSARA